MLIRISTDSAWKIMKFYSRKTPCDFKVRCLWTQPGFVHTSEQNFMHAPGPDEPLKFYDCLVFSQIINSYPLVAVFEFLVVRMISIQFFCWHFVEDRRLLQGTAAGDIFCPYFSDATLLPALLQKRSEMFMLFLLGLRAIHININKDSKLSTKGYF